MSYSIRFDSDRRVLRLALSGFWAPPVFAAFAAEFEAAVRDIAHAHGRFDTFADASGLQVQSVDVAQGFRYLKHVALAACPSARTAILFDSALTRMQARREVVDHTMRIFESEAEALDWLATVPA